MGKNTIERLLYLDEKLRSRNYPSKKMIAAHFEVSLKTIERDIDYMRDRLGAPILYDRSQEGYFYSEEGYYLPAFHFQQQEALALYFSHYLGSAWKGTPLAEAAETLWKRFYNFMEKNILLDPTAFSETVFLVDQSVKFSPQVWLGVYTAMRKRHKIRIRYSSLQYEHPANRTLHPYRLIHHQNNWYILAHDEHRQKPLAFCISRIEQIEELDCSYALPENFRIEDYIDPHFGIHIGGEPFQMKLSADRNMYRVVLEHVPSEDAKVEHFPDGKALISFTSTQREEMKYWLLKWGKNIEVIAPEWMRDELSEIGKYYIETYSK